MADVKLYEEGAGTNIERYASMRIYGSEKAISILREVQSNTLFWDEVARMKLSGKIEAPKA